MHTYIDSQNRSWEIGINVNTSQRVRDRLSVNLLDISESKLFEQLAGDPVLLVNVLWCLSETTAKQRDVSQEDFGASLVGDAIESAVNALVEEIISFFPSQRRNLLMQMWRKTSEVAQAATALAQTKLEQIDPSKIAASMFSDSATASGESSASIQAASASVS